MLVKGTLVGNYSKVAPEVEMNLDHKYVEQIRKEYLEELLDATIKVAVDSEHLDVLDDIDEWHDYVGELLSDPKQLFDDFAEGHIHEMIKESAEEIYENNKPKYYPVDVHFVADCRIYVKARSEDEVTDVLDYKIDAVDIFDACGTEVEISVDDYYIGDEEDEDRIKYSDVVYDKEQGYFM